MRRYFYISEDGLPIVLAAAAVGVLFALLNFIYLSVPTFVFGFLAALFFRDPERKIPEQPSFVLSPADGKIIELIDSVRAPGFEDSDLEFKKVSIFMSVLNVHVNRIPWPGKILKSEHAKGKFFHAGSHEATVKNESNALFIIDEAKGYRFLIRQIAGSLARRIVCKAKEGELFIKGQRFGMIKFGSRVELFMPKSFDFAVKIGDKVKGGLTVLGKDK